MQGVTNFFAHKKHLQKKVKSGAESGGRHNIALCWQSLIERQNVIR